MEATDLFLETQHYLWRGCLPSHRTQGRCEQSQAQKANG